MASSNDRIELRIAKSNNQYSTFANTGDVIIYTRQNNKLILQSGNSAGGLVINSNNNVGIGISNPSYQLDVSGNVAISDTLYVSKRFIAGNDVFSVNQTQNIVAINNNLLYADTSFNRIAMSGLPDPSYNNTLRNTTLIENLTTPNNINASSITLTGGTPIVISSNTKINNLNADLLDGLDSTKFMRTDANTGTTGSFTANRLISLAPNGTEPLTVISTSKVTNLNVDLFDDQDSSFYRNANNINSGTLIVPYGGIGTQILTSNKLLVGNGTNLILSPSNLTWNNNNLDVSGNITVNNTLYTTNIDFSGNLFQNGNLYISSQWTDTSNNNLFYNNYVGIGTDFPIEQLDVSGNIQVTENILPKYNLISDLGTSSKRFRDLYLSGSTIDISGALIKYDPVTQGIKLSNYANTTVGATFLDVFADGNVTVGGDLTVNGNIVSLETTTVIIEDPIITLGGYQTLTFNDNKDRGIEFKYYDGSSKVGFFGYDNNTSNLVYLLNATNNGEIFTGTYGNIKANQFISDISDGSPFTVNSTTLINNLNTELLNNQPGSYYNDWNNLTNKPNLVNTFNSRVGDISLNATDISTALTYVPLDATTYTASDILNKLKTVDGSGSQLDADFLDGQDSSFYRNASNINAGILSVTYGGIGVNNLATNRLLVGNATNGILSPNDLTFVNGNLGIGSQIPTQVLDVSGNINFSGYLYQNGSPYIGSQWIDSSNNGLYYGGNVGIGTSNPSQTLDVSGTMIVNNFIVRDEWMIANDTPYIRTQLQIQGIQKTFVVTDLSKNTFDISMNGRYYLESPNQVHVFIDGVKLGYFNNSNNDYNVSINNQTTITYFIIILNESAIQGNVVDIIVYPRFLTNEASKEPGYVYQVINSPWDISNNSVYYNEGNVGIGTIYPQVALDVSGNVIISGSLIASNIIGNTSTATQLATPRKISLQGDVSGNVIFDGSSDVVINSTIQPNSISLNTDISGVLNVGFGGIGTQVLTPNKLLIGNGTNNILSPIELTWNNQFDVSANIQLSGHLLPTNNITSDLGSSTKRFRDLYLSGSTIDLSGALIKYDTVTDGIKLVNYADNTLIARFKDVITDGNVTVGGDLTVNGNVVSLETTTVIIEDPVITLGGSLILNSNDSKDRGIEFKYYNGSSKVGFFGFDNSTQNLVYLLDASNNGEIFTGTYGNIRANQFIGDSLNITSTSLINNLNTELLNGQPGSYYNNWNNLTNIPDLVNTFNGRIGDVSLNATDISTALTYVPLDSSIYTGSDILNKLITVDGSGSQLDADFLDGQDSSYYRNASNINSGILSVTYGGIGVNNLSTNKLLVGNATNGILSPNDLTFVNGNLGIGSQIPSQVLDVSGNINFSGYLYQNGSPYIGSQWVDSSDNGLYYNAGNVGIGTINPTQTLDISGTMIVNNFIVRDEWMIANDTPYIRTQLQIQPISRTFKITSNNTTVFDISLNGRYIISNPLNVQVYIDGIKLGYYDVSNNDYTVISNTFTTYTQFLVTLNTGVNIDNIVDITIYPKFLSDSAIKEPGYVYQVINSPWDISNNKVFYNGSVGIGTSIPQVSLDVSGNVIISGSLTANNIIGNTSTATNLLTPRKISLQGDVSGNVMFDGSSDVVINSTIQPNSVELGTDTFGNYIATITSGSDISVLGSGTESATVTVSNTSTLQSVTNRGSNTTNNITAPQFVSSTSTLPPFTINSSSKVVNLNADLLDGLDGAYYLNSSNINTGTLSVLYGGIGTQTLTPNKLLIGNGTNNVLSPIELTWNNQLDVSANIQLSGHLLPTNNITSDLGSSTKRFRDLYLSGTTIDLSGALIKYDTATDGIKLVNFADNTLIARFKDVITDGNVTVGGDLTVNGNIVSLETTTVIIEDPIITLGGYQVLTMNDNKDRGVEFKYYDGSSKAGFFGYDNNTQNLVYLLDASNNGEVFIGTFGNIRANQFIGDTLNVTSTSLINNLNTELLNGQPGSYYNDWNNLTNKPNLVNTFNGRIGDVSLNATDISTALTYVPLNAATYTASDILNKLITVDGSGSQLDADYLDGQDSSYYRNASNINAGILSVTYGGIGVNNLSTNKLLVGNATNGILSPNDLTFINGNLGIGSQIPTQVLDVSGNINFSGSLYKNGFLYISSQWTDSSNNGLYYEGNVGIGTVNPTQTLDISGTMIVNNFIVRDEWMIANDTPYIRTQLQIQGIQRTFIVTDISQNSFDISMNGRYYLESPSKVHVFINGIKLNYYDISNNDYTVIINNQTNITYFTIVLTEFAIQGNVIDIIVYPRFLTNEATKEPGYVYQVINSPWDISNNLVYYSSGNVGIGTIYPQVALDVSGNVIITGSLTANNIIGNTSTATNLLTPRKISLQGDVSGNVMFDGSSDVTINSTIQPNSVDLNTDVFGLLNVGYGGIGTQTLTPNKLLVGNGTNSVISPIELTWTNQLDVSSNIQLSGHLLPTNNISSDLGSSSKRFRDLYLSGSTIDLSGALIKYDSTTDGIKLVNYADNTLIARFKDVITDGNVTVGGDFTVNGTFTTLNTETVTIEDPIITLGGYQVLTFNDNKDRGIEFKYYDGSSKVGFFGYDNNTQNLVYLLDASNNGEIFNGTLGNIRANTFIGDTVNVTSTNLISNLNADLLDGQEGSYYNNWNNLTNKPNLVNTFNSRIGDVSLNATDISTALTYVPLDAATYTASDILNKLITVDGSGSQLDADYLDGNDSTFYRNSSNINAGILSVTYGGIGVNNLSTNKLLVGNATNGILSPNDLTFVNGNLGIGSQIPSQVLDVSGNINFSGYLYQNGSPYIGSQWTDSSNNGLYFGGNVGIGTSNPTQTLDISGTMIVNNFIVRDEWMIANDTPYIRTQLQIQPISRTFKITSNYITVFDISLNGRYTIHNPSNVHVYIDGIKLGYYDVSNNDYSVTVNTFTIYTQFLITLNTGVHIDNVVDIVIYPKFLSDSAIKEPGYVYQVINSPWDISNNKVFYNGSVGIGTSNPLQSLDVSGNVIISGSLTANNIIGNTSTATNLLTPRKISLQGDVSGNVMFDGSSDVTINSTIQPNSVSLILDVFGILPVSNGGTGTQLLTPNKLLIGNGTNNILSPIELTWNNQLDVSANIQLSGHLLPSDNITSDLGSSSKRFRDLYLSGSTIDLSGALIKYDTTTDGIKLVNYADNTLIARFKDVITDGNVTVGGDLTVNGTFTTLNTDTVTVEDPIITLGGYQTLTFNDSKDRGVEFKYFDGSSKIGFFGFDNNTQNLVYLLDASNNGEIFTGTYGNIKAGQFIGDTLSVTSSGLISNLNADLLDGQHGSYYNDWNNLTNKPNLVNTVNGRVGDISLNATDISTALTYVPLNTSIYTASDILNKLITVDGSGSQLDADYLDGNDSTFYRNSSNINAGVLSVTYGGIGVNNLSTNRLLVGNGTNGILSPNDLSWDSITNLLDISGNVQINYLIQKNGTVKNYKLHYGDIFYNQGNGKYIGYRIQWDVTGSRKKEIRVKGIAHVTGMVVGFIRFEVLIDTLDDGVIKPGKFYELECYAKQVNNINNLAYSITRYNDKGIELRVLWDNLVTDAHASIQLEVLSPEGNLTFTEIHN